MMRLRFSSPFTRLYYFLYGKKQLTQDNENKIKSNLTNLIWTAWILMIQGQREQCEKIERVITYKVSNWPKKWYDCEQCFHQLWGLWGYLMNEWFRVLKFLDFRILKGKSACVCKVLSCWKVKRSERKRKKNKKLIGISPQTKLHNFYQNQKIIFLLKLKTLYLYKQMTYFLWNLDYLKLLKELDFDFLSYTTKPKQYN